MHERLHHAGNVGEVAAGDRVPLAPDPGYAAHGPVDLAWFMSFREDIGANAVTSGQRLPCRMARWQSNRKPAACKRCQRFSKRASESVLDALEDDVGEG
jgi:hypothetical protein